MLCCSVYITNPVERELRIRFQAVLSNSAAGTSADEEKKLQLVEEEEKKEVVESGSTAALQPPLWSALPSTPSCSASVQSDWVHLSAYDDIVEESAVWQDKQKQASEQFKDNPQVRALTPSQLEPSLHLALPALTSTHCPLSLVLVGGLPSPQQGGSIRDGDSPQSADCRAGQLASAEHGALHLPDVQCAQPSPHPCALPVVRATARDQQ